MVIHSCIFISVEIQRTGERRVGDGTTLMAIVCCGPAEQRQASMHIEPICIYFGECDVE